MQTQLATNSKTLLLETFKENLKSFCYFQQNLDIKRAQCDCLFLMRTRLFRRMDIFLAPLGVSSHDNVVLVHSIGRVSC